MRTGGHCLLHVRPGDLHARSKKRDSSNTRRRGGAVRGQVRSTLPRGSVQPWCYPKLASRLDGCQPRTGEVRGSIRASTIILAVLEQETRRGDVNCRSIQVVRRNGSAAGSRRTSAWVRKSAIWGLGSSQVKAGPWRWRSHGKLGTVELSRPSHSFLEEVDAADLSHITHRPRSRRTYVSGRVKSRCDRKASRMLGTAMKWRGKASNSRCIAGAAVRACLRLACARLATHFGAKMGNTSVDSEKLCWNATGIAAVSAMHPEQGSGASSFTIASLDNLSSS